jgi:hypothetical protein
MLRLPTKKFLALPLFAADPQLERSEDVEVFTSYRDCRKFMHFMMALREDFEPTRASILHCTLLPKLNATVAELISEEI